MIEVGPGRQALKLTKLDFRHDMSWRDLAGRFARVWTWIAAALRQDLAYGIVRRRLTDAEYIGGRW